MAGVWGYDGQGAEKGGKGICGEMAGTRLLKGRNAKFLVGATTNGIWCGNPI